MTNLTPFRKRAQDMRNEIWDSFTDFLGDNFFASDRSDTYQFRTDIKDNGDYYLIEAELPGFDKEDIKVDYEQNYLTVSAKREDISKEEKDNYIRQERHFGEFFRRFYVEDIDENTIDAKFKNGLLTLNCPKKAIAKTEQKRIEIH